MVAVKFPNQSVLENIHYTISIVTLSYNLTDSKKVQLDKLKTLLPTYVTQSCIREVIVTDENSRCGHYGTIERNLINLKKNI